MSKIVKMNACHIYIYNITHIHMHMYIHICINICTYICIYIYIFVYMIFFLNLRVFIKE